MEALIKAFHRDCLSTRGFTKAAGRKKLISFEDMIQREKTQFLLTISNPLDSGLNDTYVQIL